MTTTDEAGMRRSARERSKPQTLYDEAEAVAQKSLSQSTNASSTSGGGGSSSKDRSSSKRGSHGGSAGSLRSSGRKIKKQLEEGNKVTHVEMDEQQDERAMDEDKEDERVASSSSEDEDDSSEEEEVTPTKRPAPKKKNASSPRRRVSVTPRQLRPPKARTIQVRFADKSRKTTANKKKATTAAKTPASNRRAVQNALNALAKKVLHENETPKNSLFAALLQAHEPPPVPAAGRRGGGKQMALTTTSTTTMYTPQLQVLARRVIAAHDGDAQHNGAQVQLLNLLFRSMGASSTKSLLDENTDVLENMSDEEWATVMTKLSEEMAQATADAVPMCADPSGAAGSSSKAKGGGILKASMAAREYRAIFLEFWYVLGTTILSDAGVTVKTSAKKKAADDSSMDEDSDEENPAEEAGTTLSGSSRFQIDLAHSIVLRLTDLVNVGQPDIRATAVNALYQMAIAVLERTVTVQAKLKMAERQHKAAAGSHGRNNKRQVAALQQQVKQHQRAVTDLEHCVTDTVIAGVFSSRYRDSNPFIRAASLHALARFCVVRPDSFLQGRTLKYFGWLLSDKQAVVRQAALDGLCAPFVEFEAQQQPVNSKSDALKIDLTHMRPVIEKFLPRLADSVIDVDVGVQEKAMELLLILSRHAMLESMEEDSMWEQINSRALASDTSPEVRRKALLFVLDQLEAFDETVKTSSESRTMSHLNALADWIAHSLADSKIPIDHMRFELTDHIVAAMRTTPELKPTICNWSALLRALQSDYAPTSATSRPDMESVQKRVILRMLITSAKAEVLAVDGNSNEWMAEHSDPAVLEARGDATVGGTQNSSKKRMETTVHEELTLSLLRALPDLLQTFKNEAELLRQLTSLPHYFLPSVLSLPSCKKDFTTLVSKMAQIFSECSDIVVLQNCALAMTLFAKGSHARSGEALLKLKKTALGACKRLSDVAEEKKAFGDDADAEDVAEKMHQICLCQRRLLVLAKRWYMGDLLGNESDKSGDVAVENVCLQLIESAKHELAIRRLPGGGDEKSETSMGWLVDRPALNEGAAHIVDHTLNFLLATTAWLLHKCIEGLDHEGDDIELDDYQKAVIGMRDNVAKLSALCFEQHVKVKDCGDSCSAEQLAFSTAVQESALRVHGDLRALFPRTWANAKSHFLRACALVNDGFLVGGAARFLLSQQEQFVACKEQAQAGESGPVDDILLPLARGLSFNWSQGNRREAGAVLMLATGHGDEAGKLISDMSRILKRLDPVRLLEAHMASLRASFDDWADAEPEDVTSSHPTEEELAAYDEAVKEHKQMLQNLELRSQRLSGSLGVGKLARVFDEPMLGFVREGIRFSFSTKEPEFDEELPLGAQLPFLRVTSKYVTWLRRDRLKMNELRALFNRKEADLRNHPDFLDVTEEDLEAISLFRKAAELGEFVVKDEGDDDEAGAILTAADADDEDSFDNVPSEHDASSTNLRRRMSIASSVSSIKSKFSNRAMADEDASSVGSLRTDAQSRAETSVATSVAAMLEDSMSSENDSPLSKAESRGTSPGSSGKARSKRPSGEMEGDDDDDDDDSPVSKRSRRSSAAAAAAAPSLPQRLRGRLSSQQQQQQRQSQSSARSSKMATSQEDSDDEDASAMAALATQQSSRSRRSTTKSADMEDVPAPEVTSQPMPESSSDDEEEENDISMPVVRRGKRATDPARDK